MSEYKSRERIDRNKNTDWREEKQNHAKKHNQQRKATHDKKEGTNMNNGRKTDRTTTHDKKQQTCATTEIAEPTQVKNAPRNARQNDG